MYRLHSFILTSLSECTWIWKQMDWSGAPDSMGRFWSKICRVIPQQYQERCKTTAYGTRLTDYPDKVSFSAPCYVFGNHSLSASLRQSHWSLNQQALNTFSDRIKVLSTIVRLYKDYKPFGFFSLLSAVLALTGAVFFVPVFRDYISTGMVERFPTLIVCGFVMVIAILLFMIGIILTTLRVKDRHDFEYWLQ